MKTSIANKVRFISPTVFGRSFFAYTLIVTLLLCSLSRAEDLADAITEGKVSVRFHGLGGSSGDSVEVIVTRTAKSIGMLDLTVPAGTRLQSGSSSSQSMVVSGVKGQMMDERRYSPGSVIEVGDEPKTYIIEAYCAEFEKENPSPATKFEMGKVDPLLACILTGAAGLSPVAKQAAVWIYTDRATFGHVNRKFPVSRADWDKAQTIVSKCLNGQAPAKGKTKKTSER